MIGDAPPPYGTKIHNCKCWSFETAPKFVWIIPDMCAMVILMLSKVVTSRDECTAERTKYNNMYTKIKTEGQTVLWNSHKQNKNIENMS
jgi:hypothetical protein